MHFYWSNLVKAHAYIQIVKALEVNLELHDYTKNQHFISQAEQRLNCINPNASKRNQKIYSFKIDVRESHSIIFNGAKKIEAELSITDLFCFSKNDSSVGQLNFEKLFHRYENDITEHTESLLAKVAVRDSNVDKELMYIFISKVMNFIRNPYSIKKVLNTFPSLLNVHPTDPLIYKQYEQVLIGRKPQQKRLCEQLGINDLEYEQWLRVIFMLLMPIDKSDYYNFLESTIAGMYTDPEIKVGAILFTYDNVCCLLSDRGHNFYALTEQSQAWEFNLNRHAFIRFGFANIDELLSRSLTKEQLEFAKKIKPNVKLDVSLEHRHNDFTELANYNRITVYQSATNVFSSSLDVSGL